MSNNIAIRYDSYIIYDVYVNFLLILPVFYSISSFSHLLFG